MTTRHGSVPRVSFVIPVRNDAARLERCIRSIIANGYPRASVDILVIDNGSTDSSAAVAAALGADVVSMPHHRVAALRNEGAKRARGEVLAFVDADHEIVPDWIQIAVDTLRRPDVAATGALYCAPDSGTWVQRTYGLLRGRPEGRHDVEWLGGGNMAMLRSTFERSGGFDTTLSTCEDVEFCNRLRARGGRIVSDARLKSVHYGDPVTLRELFVGELWRGRDNLRVSVDAPLTWRGLPSIILPIADLALLLVLTAGVVLAIGGRVHGLLLALLACSTMLTAAWLRSARCFSNAREGGIGRLMALFAVTCVYDVARALALVSRMPHRRKQVAQS